MRWDSAARLCVDVYTQEPSEESVGQEAGGLGACRKCGVCQSARGRCYPLLLQRQLDSLSHAPCDVVRCAPQAMDRAHRLGQKRTVNVYRVLTRNTLEEKIMSLQRFKLDIANAVVNQVRRRNAALHPCERQGGHVRRTSVYEYGWTAIAPRRLHHQGIQGASRAHWTLQAVQSVLCANTVGVKAAASHQSCGGSHVVLGVLWAGRTT